ncbi:kinase-like domain-containing protein [Cyathus striatus]|nr:kinase-like domain-containing protein [Cyathus striatus]
MSRGMMQVASTTTERDMVHVESSPFESAGFLIHKSEEEIVDASFDNKDGINPRLIPKPVPSIFKQRLGQHYAGDILKHVASVFSEEAVLDICRGLLCVLSELHAQDILHGSICATNVSWNAGSVSLNNAKLFVAFQHRLEQVPVLPCTPYRPKDELERDEYTPSKYGDMYALSVLIYAVFSGKEPYADYLPCQRVSKIIQSGHLDLKRPLLMPLFIWKILLDCWSAKPEHRWLAFDRLKVALQFSEGPSGTSSRNSSRTTGEFDNTRADSTPKPLPYPGTYLYNRFQRQFNRVESEIENKTPPLPVASREDMLLSNLSPAEVDGSSSTNPTSTSCKDSISQVNVLLVAETSSSKCPQSFVHRPGRPYSYILFPWPFARGLSSHYYIIYRRKSLVAVALCCRTGT